MLELAKEILGRLVAVACLQDAGFHDVSLTGQFNRPKAEGRLEASVHPSESWVWRERATVVSAEPIVARSTALPDDLTGFDLAFAIEAFVHADPAAPFFDGVARALRPGGALVIVDDVRAGDRDDPALDDVSAGWHAPSLLSVAAVEALAARAGLTLVASHDLSALQRLGRPRDRFIHALLPLLRRLRRRSMWAQSLVGGDALQHCHRAGLLEYRMLRFERRGT
jgi:SAM-dependent methyltransferase